MQIELFDARMLNPLVGFLERNGARAEALLDPLRIPREVIHEGGWVTKRQAYDFAFNVVHKSGCRDAVFTAYLGFEFEHLGPIARVMKSCQTVKESLEIGTRLGSIAYEGNEYFLHIDGDTTWFCYRESQAVSERHTFINDMTLTVYYQLIRFLVDENWRPDRMLIRREVIDRHRTVENFGNCQVSYHSEFSALAFPTEFLGRRLNKKDFGTEFQENHGWVHAPVDSAPIVDALYRLMISRLCYRRLLTLEQVAKILGVSAATIKRELAVAGKTFRDLIDGIRFDQACEMLLVPELSINEIAQELGYSGTNNFVRGFLRMTGTTPGNYRRQLLASKPTNGSA